MTPETPPNRARNRIVLGALVLVFVGPIVLAWLFATGLLDLHGRKLVNLGELLRTPLDLGAQHDRPGIAPLLKLAPSEWAIVYVDPEACGATCTKVLDDLLVLRELLGEGGVRTSIHAVTGGPPDAPRHAARVHVDGQAVSWLRDELAAHGSPGPFPSVVLVDWRHQLMLRYAPDDRRAIQKDLKRLLRASAIR